MKISKKKELVAILAAGSLVAGAAGPAFASAVAGGIYPGEEPGANLYVESTEPDTVDGPVENGDGDGAAAEWEIPVISPDEISSDEPALFAESATEYVAYSKSGWGIDANGHCDIPKGTTEITSDEFASVYSTLVSVYIPSSVNTVSGTAFYAFPNLESVVFASNCAITTLPEGCFKLCQKLSHVELPSSLKKLPKSIFEKCGFTNLDDFAGITIFGESCLAYNSQMKDLYIPSSAKNILAKAFCDYSSDYSGTIYFPDGFNVNSVAANAFSGRVQYYDQIRGLSFDQAKKIGGIKRPLQCEPPATTYTVYVGDEIVPSVVDGIRVDDLSTTGVSPIGSPFILSCSYDLSGVDTSKTGGTWVQPTLTVSGVDDITSEWFNCSGKMMRVEVIEHPTTTYTVNTAGLPTSSTLASVVVNEGISPSEADYATVKSSVIVPAGYKYVDATIDEDNHTITLNYTKDESQTYQWDIIAKDTEGNVLYTDKTPAQWVGDETAPVVSHRDLDSQDYRYVGREDSTLLGSHTITLTYEVIPYDVYGVSIEQVSDKGERTQLAGEPKRLRSDKDATEESLLLADVLDSTTIPTGYKVSDEGWVIDEDNKTATLDIVPDYSQTYQWTVKSTGLPDELAIDYKTPAQWVDDDTEPTITAPEFDGYVYEGIEKDADSHSITLKYRAMTSTTWLVATSGLDEDTTQTVSVREDETFDASKYPAPDAPDGYYFVETVKDDSAHSLTHKFAAYGYNDWQIVFEGVKNEHKPVVSPISVREDKTPVLGDDYSQNAIYGYKTTTDPVIDEDARTITITYEKDMNFSYQWTVKSAGLDDDNAFEYQTDPQWIYDETVPTVNIVSFDGYYRPTTDVDKTNHVITMNYRAIPDATWTIEVDGKASGTFTLREDKFPVEGTDFDIPALPTGYKLGEVYVADMSRKVRITTVPDYEQTYTWTFKSEGLADDVAFEKTSEPQWVNDDTVPTFESPSIDGYYTGEQTVDEETRTITAHYTAIPDATWTIETLPSTGERGQFQLREDIKPVEGTHFDTPDAPRGYKYGNTVIDEATHTIKHTYAEDHNQTYQWKVIVNGIEADPYEHAACEPQWVLDETIPEYDVPTFDGFQFATVNTDSDKHIIMITYEAIPMNLPDDIEVDQYAEWVVRDNLGNELGSITLDYDKAPLLEDWAKFRNVPDGYYFDDVEMTRDDDMGERVITLNYEKIPDAGEPVDVNPGLGDEFVEPSHFDDEPTPEPKHRTPLPDCTPDDELVKTGDVIPYVVGGIGLAAIIAGIIIAITRRKDK